MVCTHFTGVCPPGRFLAADGTQPAVARRVGRHAPAVRRPVAPPRVPLVAPPRPQRENAVVGRRELAVLRLLGQCGAHPVQIHVHAARQHGRVVQQGLALEPAFPETARAPVLLVRPAGHRLAQAPHQPRQAAQAPAALGRHFRIGHQHGQLVPLRLGRQTVVAATPRKQPPPPPGHLFVRPCGGHVWPCSHDNVQVIVHHRIAAHVDAEDAGQLLQALANPALAVVEALAGHHVMSTEKRPPHAPRDAVVHPNLALAHDLPPRIRRHDDGLLNGSRVQQATRRLRGVRSHEKATRSWPGWQ